MLVTFALFVYNQEKFVREAIRGAFSQGYSPLQIIISDDFSTDETFRVIEEEVSVYRGGHEILINRNNENLGLAAHVNKIFSMASGDLIIAAAGDDISLPSRAEKLVEFYKNNNKPYLIHSRAIEVGVDGVMTGRILPGRMLLKKKSISDASVSSALYLGATAAWSKRLFIDFGPISQSLAYEDLVLGFRAILMGGFLFLDEPLVIYRRGAGITSGGVHGSILCLRFKHYSVLRSVFIQRQFDAGKFFGSADNKISRRLVFNIGLANVALSFYSNPVSLFLNLLRHPWLTIGFLSKELKTIVLAICRRFFE